MTTMGPLPEPVAGSSPAPPAALTADQQSKYEQLLAEVRAWESLPASSAKGAEATPLDDDERLWLTRECLLRYLRATKWNLAQASTRLRATAVWRREFGTEKLSAAYISPENEKGKQVQLGFDNAGRPCLYLLPQNQNTKPGPRQVEHLVYMLERTIDLHPPGQESLALLIDFRNTSSGGTPGLGIAKQVLDILQNHYPERLGRALLTHLPWYVSMFLKAINPFIDPVTKEKIKYNEPLTDHVPASQLMKASGGAIDFQYDHDVYWPALEQLAAARRAQRVERWEKAGKLIGESELYLWGGAEGSVGGEQAASSTAPIAPTSAPPVDAAPAPLSDSAVVAPPVHAPGPNADAALAHDVAKLHVQDGEAPQSAA